MEITEEDVRRIAREEIEKSISVERERRGADILEQMKRNREEFLDFLGDCMENRSPKHVTLL